MRVVMMKELGLYNANGATRDSFVGSLINVNRKEQTMSEFPRTVLIMPSKEAMHLCKDPYSVNFSMMISFWCRKDNLNVVYCSLIWQSKCAGISDIFEKMLIEAKTWLTLYCWLVHVLKILL
jgi:hypothetical protein